VLNQILGLLTWLLLPIGAITLIDDWFLRPQRRIAALPSQAIDPPWIRICYGVFPVLIVAGAFKLLRAERLDFSLVLVLVSLIGGAIWAFDSLVLRPGRDRATLAKAQPVTAVAEPGIVDYARSMVPVVVAVLVLRSFLFEPFRIPSDSMMPTLQDGDFILVNKYMYGLRLPVVNKKIVSIGEPKRGDVVVFRYPPDPAVNYIKRLVGLPGDRIRVEADRIYVNGVALSAADQSRYSDGCYENMLLSEERIGEHVHKTLSCPSPFGISNMPLPGCNRELDRGYVCPSEVELGSAGDRGDYPETVVPEGHYLMMGDNRDNSEDGRYWGFVPEANLVGSARRVWFNLDLQRSPWTDWGRILRKIE
jgi:signal peptidase I